MDVAETVSRMLHPIPVIIGTSLGAMYLIDPALNPFRWIGHSLVFILLPLVAYYAYGRKTHGFEKNGNRNRIYGLGLILASFYTFYMYIAGAAPSLWMTSLSVIVSGVLFASINVRTKISVHTGVLSGSASVITALEPFIGGFLFLCVPVVGWSRIRLDHHTTRQVLIGSVIPPLVFLTVFYLGSS